MHPSLLKVQRTNSIVQTTSMKGFISWIRKPNLCFFTPWPSRIYNWKILILTRCIQTVRSCGWRRIACGKQFFVHFYVFLLMMVVELISKNVFPLNIKLVRCFSIPVLFPFGCGKNQGYQWSGKEKGSFWIFLKKCISTSEKRQRPQAMPDWEILSVVNTSLLLRQHYNLPTIQFNCLTRIWLQNLE